MTLKEFSNALREYANVLNASQGTDFGIFCVALEDKGDKTSDISLFGTVDNPQDLLEFLADMLGDEDVFEETTPSDTCIN